MNKAKPPQTAPAPPDAPAALSPAWLGLAAEDLDALAVRLWCPVPESVKRLLRETWALPPELARSESARRRERALLALPLLAVGLSVPGAELDRKGDLRFSVEFSQAAADVKTATAKGKPPQKSRTSKARALARMQNAAARAGRLCGDDDGARWLPVVRKIGIGVFVAVLETAERRKAGDALDADGKPIRNWGAYLLGMLDRKRVKGGEE